MKIDNGYFYDIEPIMDIEHFVELFLVTLAKNDTSNKPIAILPADYKEKIETIMYSEVAIKFLKLIDSYEYYEKQSSWESKLSKSFKEYLNNNNKEANYNFKNDHVEITYSLEEIEEILNKYDEETQELMEDLLFLIEFNDDYDRHSKLIHTEAERSITRNYIFTSSTTFTNVWTKSSLKEDKTIKITVNPQYIKK